MSLSMADYELFLNGLNALGDAVSPRKMVAIEHALSLETANKFLNKDEGWELFKVLGNGTFILVQYEDS